MRTKLIRPANANGNAAPSHLPRPEQQLWNELRRTYRIDDAAAKELLTQACEARMRARLCRLTVAEEGATVTDKKGIVRAHPLLQIERSAQASFISALRLLRLDLSGTTMEASS
jgi:phage terminase small subunit